MEGQVTAAAAERVLCLLDDIPDGESKGFAAAPGGFTGLFAVRRGDRVWVYVNSCPHIGVPLDPVPDRFLDRKREHVVCSTHGAVFRYEDGHCEDGPCKGRDLESVPIVVSDDRLVRLAD